MADFDPEREHNPTVVLLFAGILTVLAFTTVYMIISMSEAERGQPAAEVKKS